MNKKLTLLLDEKIITRAKNYANLNNESLSGMVEKYFTYLTGKASPEGKEAELPVEIEAMIGIIKVPDSKNVKDEYRRHRADKAMHD